MSYTHRLLYVFDINTNRNFVAVVYIYKYTHNSLYVSAVGKIAYDLLFANLGLIMTANLMSLKVLAADVRRKVECTNKSISSLARENGIVNGSTFFILFIFSLV